MYSRVHVVPLTKSSAKNMEKEKMQSIKCESKFAHLCTESSSAKQIESANAKKLVYKSQIKRKTGASTLSHFYIEPLYIYIYIYT